MNFMKQQGSAAATAQMKVLDTHGTGSISFPEYLVNFFCSCYPGTVHANPLDVDRQISF